MSKWISGKELLARYGLRSFELFDLVRGGLQPFDAETGQPVFPPEKIERSNSLKHWQMKFEIAEDKLENLALLKGAYENQMRDMPMGRTGDYNGLIEEFDEEKEKKKLKDEIANAKKQIDRIIGESSPLEDPSWKASSLPDSIKERKEIVNQLTQAIYRWDEVHKLPGLGDISGGEGEGRKKKKKLRPSQKHRENCRKVAKRIWAKDPNITIKAMIVKEEILQACGWSTYTPKTLRNWVKDLAPNRKPGRRPKEHPN
jgi:hypothetical protein